MRKFTVRVKECSNRDNATDKTVRIHLPDKNQETGEDTNDADAVFSAVKKIFGKTVIWQPDSGLGFFYGQVFKPIPPKRGGGYSSVTGRMEIDVSE